jgi:hypothetical protein
MPVSIDVLKQESLTTMNIFKVVNNYPVVQAGETTQHHFFKVIFVSVVYDCFQSGLVIGLLTSCIQIGQLYFTVYCVGDKVRLKRLQHMCLGLAEAEIVSI